MVYYIVLLCMTIFEKTRGGSLKMSLLTKKEIVQQRKIGNIIIHPFNSRNLQAVGYDVRIGPWFFRAELCANDLIVCNPLDDNMNYWGKPQRAVLADEWIKRNHYPLKNISPEDYIIVVRPGELILVHTVEFIGGLHYVATEMRTRSSVARIGGATCKCAGRGDPGFVNRWTMEFSNSGTAPVIIPVGMRVAQILFYSVELVTGYAEKGGKYQSTGNIQEIIKKWKPKDMLPKLYLDKEIGQFRQHWDW